VAANGCSASPPARRTSSASRRALPGGGLDFAGDIEAALAEKVGWVRAAAEARFARLELAALIWNVAVTDDRWTAAEEVAAARGLTAE
jgi:hypothetical protein